MWTFADFENSFLMALESLSYVREQYLASKDIFLILVEDLTKAKAHMHIHLQLL